MNLREKIDVQGLIHHDRHGIFAPVALSFVVIMTLAPFLNKAYHVDDPLFLWSARYIQEHLLNFYGFSVNWYGSEMPMYEVMKNPPVTAYVLAGAAYLCGWSEVALHSFFLLFAVAAALGTYFLALAFSTRPLIAALIGVLSPCFILAGTTVMCDMMMLSFWVWSIYFWVRGIRDGSTTNLVAAALLVSLACMTKYFGICLIPLLLAYAVVQKRGIGRWILALLIPVLVLAGYEWLTHDLYGKGLLSSAFLYPSLYREIFDRHIMLNTLEGLTFTGGCLISTLFFAPLLWNKKTLGLLACMTMLLIAVILLSSQRDAAPFFLASGFNWRYVVQCYVFSFAGVSVLLLAARDMINRRDAASLLLFLWIAGTFIFASYVNWSINGRSIFPMTPAAGILIARWMEHDLKWTRRNSALWSALPIASSALIALLVARADYQLAGAARAEATELHQLRYSMTIGDLWFQGHWGFQYYMESIGGRPIDFRAMALKSGDLVVIPSNNTNRFPLEKIDMRLVAVSNRNLGTWVTTMYKPMQAGYYLNEIGALPYAFGEVPDEKYYRMLVK